MKNLILSSVLLIIVTLGSFIARSYGLYFKYALTDIVLHFLSGIMFGFLWLWLVRNQKSSAFLILSSVVMFAVFGSFVWELWEYGGWKIVPFLTQNYIPTLSDSLGDIIAGMSGGAVVAALYFFTNNKLAKIN